MVFAVAAIAGRFDPKFGAVVECAVSIPGGTEPRVPVHLLINTGVSHTMIRDQLLKKAGLKLDGVVELAGYAGLLNVYTADLFVTGFGLWRPALKITQLHPQYEHPNFPNDGFFGRDLLAGCVFETNGPASTFRLLLG
jgi:hypothetical protein